MANGEDRLRKEGGVRPIGEILDISHALESAFIPDPPRVAFSPLDWLQDLCVTVILFRNLRPFICRAERTGISSNAVNRHRRLPEPFVSYPAGGVASRSRIFFGMTTSETWVERMVTVSHATSIVDRSANVDKPSFMLHPARGEKAVIAAASAPFTAQTSESDSAPGSFRTSGCRD